MKLLTTLVSGLTLVWLAACVPTESDPAPAQTESKITLMAGGEGKGSQSVEAPLTMEKLADGTVVLSSAVLKTPEGKLPGATETARVFCFLSFKGAGVGDYAAGALVNVILADSGKGRIHVAYPHGSGSVKITQYDKTGDEESEIAGTFSGTVKTGAGDVVILTNGSFHWKK